MGDEMPPDVRLDYIMSKVTPLIKANKGMWDKMMAVEEMGDMVNSFVNSEGVMKLFFLGGAKDMTVQDKLPDDKMTKKKVAYCIKTDEIKFDEKKMDWMFEYMVIGDLSPALLPHFHGLLRNVYLPVMSNPRKSGRWPDPAIKIFFDKYYNTLAQVFEAVGQTQGKTYLFLPPTEMMGQEPVNGITKQTGTKASSADKSDEKRVHILESAVVIWTSNIHTSLARQVEEAPSHTFSRLLAPSLAVSHLPSPSRTFPRPLTPPLASLARQAETIFDHGKQPGPQAALDFWTSKYVDLSDILGQLRGPQIHKTLKVLELIRSPYHASFHALCGQLEREAAEAKDNCLYLQSLKPHFDALASAEYTECDALFKPIMHVLLLVWKHSRFYNTPPALALLVRTICNDVIEKSRDHLGGTRPEPHTHARTLHSSQCAQCTTETAAPRALQARASSSAPSPRSRSRRSCRFSPSCASSRSSTTCTTTCRRRRARATRGWPTAARCSSGSTSSSRAARTSSTSAAPPSSSSGWPPSSSAATWGRRSPRTSRRSPRASTSPSTSSRAARTTCSTWTSPGSRPT